MNKRQSNRGFTIIELLVVIIVIGVLTVLTMVIYSGIQAKVFDLSVSSDIDRLNALELKYKSEHGSSGRAFYTGDGVDSEMNFIPNNGNIFDVVTDATDYCIRGYNLHGTKDSIYNAYIKESSPGACDRIPPSAAAAATPSTPLAPVIAVTMSSNEIIATITPVTCDVGTPQYGIKSRVDDGAWTSFSEWSDTTQVSRQAEEGVKYGYMAEARCYISYTSAGSAAAIGVEAFYNNYYSPSGPSVTVIQNGGNIEATVNPVTCQAGTIQYGINSRINSGEWTGYTAWSSTTTASQAATGGEGVRYGYQVRSRCYTSDYELSPTSTGSEGVYVSPITTPSIPTVTTTTTPGYATTYSWGAVSCAVGTTARYQYKLTVAPSGYDSGWAATAGLSAAFTTSTGNQTYTIQVQGQCYNTNGSSGWSGSGSDSYFCTYNSVPIATSISGSWSTVPDDYMLEDGSAISRTIYADLFAAIGTTYGAGDGSTTFNLPNSQGRTAVNKSSTDSEFDVMGEKTGEKAHILSGSESGTTIHNHTASSGNDSPDHTHGYRLESSAGGPPWYSHVLTQGSHYFNTYVANTTTGASARHTHPVTVSNATAANASSSHNTTQPSIVEVFAIKYRPATGSDSILPASTSIAGYWSTAPAGYLVEDGSAVSRTTYSDLFAAIGTTYGIGDGSTTFNLPDSRGRIAVNKSSSDTEFDTMGEKYGEKTHLLTISESGTSAHSHPASTGNDTPDHTHDYATEGGTGPPWYAHADNQTYHYFYTYPNAASTGASARHTHAITVNNSTSANAVSGHSTIQPSIVKLFAIKYTPVSAASDNTAKGTSISGYFAAAPNGYLLEDGSAVSRATYSALFAAIGTTYGAGDGSTTFNLPDSRGRVAVNKNSADVEFDTLGEKFGVKSLTITGAETGTSAHSHSASSGTDSPDHTHQYSKEGGTGTWYAHTDTQGSHYFYTYVLNGTSGASTRHTHTITVNNSVAANATSAHNNIQPSIVQMFAIRY